MRRPTNWRQGTLLGTGSYGSVFKGLNEDTGAIFAVKRIRMMESGEAADSAIASLEREVRATSFVSSVVMFCTPIMWAPLRLP